ncbi:hypothetical protein D9M70_366660 [compost metagenome]
MTQEQYWKELYQLKTHICYIEQLLEEADRTDRAVKIILAITSSYSIGAWAIWQELSWLWAGIIAASQVLSAISPFLPYKERIKSYSPLLADLEQIMIQAEFKWHSIAQGEITAAEVNKHRFEIRSLKQKSLKKNLNSTTIPTKERKRLIAEENAREYLNTFYN